MKRGHVRLVWTLSLHNESWLKQRTWNESFSKRKTETMWSRSRLHIYEVSAKAESEISPRLCNSKALIPYVCESVLYLTITAVHNDDLLKALPWQLLPHTNICYLDVFIVFYNEGETIIQRNCCVTRRIEKWSRISWECETMRYWYNLCVYKYGTFRFSSLWIRMRLPWYVCLKNFWCAQHCVVVENKGLKKFLVSNIIQALPVDSMFKNNKRSFTRYCNKEFATLNMVLCHLFF